MNESNEAHPPESELISREAAIRKAAETIYVTCWPKDEEDAEVIISSITDILDRALPAAPTETAAPQECPWCKAHPHRDACSPNCQAARDATETAALPALPYICLRCKTQQHADGICANCGSPAIAPQPDAVADEAMPPEGELISREAAIEIAERPRIQDAMRGVVYTSYDAHEIAKELRALPAAPADEQFGCEHCTCTCDNCSPCGGN